MNSMIASTTIGESFMKEKSSSKLRNGQRCQVVGGTHAGKSGVVKDVNVSKTGHTTITVVQANGDRFKTLAKNVGVKADKDA